MSDERKTEKVTIGGDTYAFRFDMQCIKELDEERGHNLYENAQTLGSGQTVPSLVHDILEVCIIEFKGQKVSVSNARQLAEQFIDEAGFQTAHTLAQELVTYFLCGGQNKKKLKSLQEATDLLNASLDFHLTSSTNRLWLWTFKTVIFGNLILLISYVLELLGLLNMT